MLTTCRDALLGAGPGAACIGYNVMNTHTGQWEDMATDAVADGPLAAWLQSAR